MLFAFYFIQRLKAFLKPRSNFSTLDQTHRHRQAGRKSPRLKISYHCHRYEIFIKKNPTWHMHFKVGWTKGYLGLAFSDTDIPSGGFRLICIYKLTASPHSNWPLKLIDSTCCPCSFFTFPCLYLQRDLSPVLAQKDLTAQSWVLTNQRCESIVFFL